MKNLNHKMNHTLYQIFKDYFKYIIKTNDTATDNSPIKMYVNRIENRITFRIKTGYYLEILTLETMKLLGSTRNKVI